MQKSLILIFITILFQSNCFAAQAAGVGELVLFAMFIAFVAIVVGASIFAYIGSKIATDLDINSVVGGWLGATLFIVLSVVFFWITFF